MSGNKNPQSLPQDQTPLLERDGPLPSSKPALTANPIAKRPINNTSSAPTPPTPHFESLNALPRNSRNLLSSLSPSGASSKPRALHVDTQVHETYSLRMSATKYTQDIDRDRRESMITKRGYPSNTTKENVIKQKLRTYEAVLALSEGYMPSTEQLTAWARYALRASGILDSRNRRLSPQGRAFVRDVRAWVEAVIELGLGKNTDDKIQEFIYNTSNAQVSARGRSISAGATTSALRPSNTEMQKTYKKLRNLGSLLYSSPEFRKLLNDSSVLAREILADAASHVSSIAGKTADQLRPTESETSEVDNAAESALADTKSELPSANQVKSQAKEKGSVYAEQTRKVGQQSRDDIESYLRQKFPKQRRDAVVNRLKRVLSEIQRNPDFQESVDFILCLMRKYGETLKSKVTQEAQKTKSAGIQTDEHFDRALEQAKAILMVFADGKPLDDINDALQQVMEDVQNDTELGDFYHDAAGFLQRALTDKSFITSDAADAEAHRLYDRSQDHLREKENKYRPDIERLFEELKSFRDAMSNDRENRRVIETSKKVFNGLVILDRNGTFKGFRRKVVKDIVDVVLPRFIGEIKYIPMPRIEYQDRDFDLILENVILESEHFIPYRTLFEAFTKAEFINDYTFSSKYAATTRVVVENINLFFKDASFVVRKKTGLIQFSDRGFIDVFMNGRGASAEIILDSVTDDCDDEEAGNESFFHVRSVKVNIYRFRYNYNAYHSWAAALLSPIIRPTVRKLLSKLLEQKIRESFESADRELHAMSERMRVASIATQGGGSVEAWVRAVLSRPDHIGRRGRDAYHVSIGGGDVLFPGEHGPGAFITKAKAAEEQVEEGGEGGEVGGAVEIGWKNEIFDLRA